MTPSARSVKALTDDGYLVWNVERWLPWCKKRIDLYGFIDLLAIRGEEILGIQATSDSNVSSRVNKITDHENLAAVRKAGIRIEVHGWRKKGKEWICRKVDLS